MSSKLIITGALFEHLGVRHLAQGYLGRALKVYWHDHRVLLLYLDRDVVQDSLDREAVAPSTGESRDPGSSADWASLLSKSDCLSSHHCFQYYLWKVQE